LDLAELFNGLSILRELAYIAHEEGDWRGFADVDVLQLEMRSPLKILLSVARLPKNAMRAFVTCANEFCSSKRSGTGEPRSPRVRGKTPREASEEY
jgi:hypothetical protein